MASVVALDCRHRGRLLYLKSEGELYNGYGAWWTRRRLAVFATGGGVGLGGFLFPWSLLATLPLSIRKGGIFFHDVVHTIGSRALLAFDAPSASPRADGNTLSPSLPLVGRRLTERVIHSVILPWAPLR